MRKRESEAHHLDDLRAGEERKRAACSPSLASSDLVFPRCSSFLLALPPLPLQ